VSAPIALGVIAASLLVAGWSAVAAVRNRWISPAQLVGLGLVELALLAQAGVSLVQLFGQPGPDELALFLAYLTMSVLVVPVAAGLAYLEPTRWGSVIVTIGAATAAVLTLRLTQIWPPP
jgi:hypothetical protein